ncbi:MAG: glycerol kinase GlpK [Candidatus Binatia bacterium]|nr:glycerol kinase GlpK [Candidatus Binatia bacterium]
MSYVLALDQGTSSTRAFVVNEAGVPIGAAQREIRQIFPRPGWVEHDPEEIWSAQLETARQALQAAGVAATEVAANGVTHQRAPVVLWDRTTGQPLYNAIVWQDRRTVDLLERLRHAGYEPLVREKTGLVLDPYFSAAKLQWLLDHVPGARVRARAGELAAGTIDAWLVYRLTAGTQHLTDVTNASRTLLWNIHTRQWDPELLALFDIPATVLPAICPSSAVVAETAPALFGTAIPIAGIAGDQQAALFGQLCHRPGMVKNTYGTGCFLLMHTGQQAILSRHHLLTTVAWQLGTQPLEYALEGSVFIAGAAIQWLRDGLGIVRSAPQVNELAASVPDAGGVYVVPAFVGLGAPHWDPHARGTIVGLTRGTTAAHLARATLESIAYQVAEVLHAIQADAGVPLVELRVDGGAAASDLLLQFQADILGVPVQRPADVETTALGAAYLAGLAVGLWPHPEAIVPHRRVDKTFLPSLSAADRAILLARWRRAVERAKGWARE